MKNAPLPAGRCAVRAGRRSGQRIGPDVARPGHGVLAFEFARGGGHTARAGHRQHGLLLGVVAVHAGHVHHVAGRDEAVAGVGVDRQRRWFLALQQRDHGGRAGLAVLVGHVARLGHGRRPLDRVAQHMDVLRRLRFEGQEVHLAPARVGGGQTGLHRDVARAHVRDHVGHAGLEVVVEIELQGVGGGVHVDQPVLGAVVDHAVVVVLPGLHEQALLGGDVVVGIEHDDLALRLGLLEVARDHAGALVGAGGAAVRCPRNGERVHAAIA